MTTVTAREFNQDVSAAKRAADQGPVIVTDRGEPAYVLLTIDDFRRLSPPDGAAFVENLRMDSDDDFDVEFPPSNLRAQIPEL